MELGHAGNLLLTSARSPWKPLVAVTHSLLPLELSQPCAVSKMEHDHAGCFLLTSDSKCEKEKLLLGFYQLCAVSQMELVHPRNLLLTSDTGAPTDDECVHVDREEIVLDGRDVTVQEEPHLLDAGANDVTMVS